MKRLLLVLPGLLGDEPNSVLSDLPRNLAAIAGQGEIVQIEPGWTLSSALGLDPESQMAPGPLAVAAFGADPPSRSVQFQVSLCSVDAGQVAAVDEPLPADIAGVIAGELARLDTRSWSFVPGHDRQHGVVWDAGSVDLRTTSPSSFPQALPAALPEGDGELHLRRFIDDSVNLLSELEFNQRRIDEGKPPVNCAWPWGQGFRLPTPNINLEFGFPVKVESGSLHLAGLARLASANHGDWRSFDRGTATPLARVAQPAPLLIASVGAFARFRKAEGLEEMAWLLHELDRVIVQAWTSLDEPVHVVVAALGADNGLALSWASHAPGAGRYPFDERALEERLPKYRLHELVRRLASA